MKNYFDKNSFKNINALPTVEFDVLEWEKTVIIKTLSAAQITSLSGMSTDDNNDVYFYKIIAMSLVDQDGTRFINDNEAKEILSNYSMTSLMSIFNEIKKLNHIEEKVENRIEELKTDPFLNS
jgi:hypothetical protein